MGNEIKIEIQCPKHGKQEVNATEEQKLKIKNRVEALSKLGSDLHKLLSEIAFDTDHPGLAKLINAQCDGNHSHGHPCDSHTNGHHHEVIAINGVGHELCDPVSVKKLLDSLTTELDRCQIEGCNHDQLKGLIDSSRKIQAKMQDLSFCTKQLCFACINERRNAASLKPAIKAKGLRPGAFRKRR